MSDQRAVVFKRQLDGPVVREVDFLPGAVVEIGARNIWRAARRLDDAPGFRERLPARAVIEIVHRIVGVAEVEPPAEIE